MAAPLLVEFPAETVEVIDQLSKELKLDRVEVISRGLGLLQLYVEAQKQNRIIVERPLDDTTGDQMEYEIKIEQ